MSTTAQRIQLRRTRGWRMPPDTVRVDRVTRWGNPFRVGTEGVPDNATAVRLFEQMLERQATHPEPSAFTYERIRAELRGKNLACWCPLDQPCHADILLRIANGDDGEIARKALGI